MTMTELARSIELTLVNVPILKTARHERFFSTLVAICDVLAC